MKLPSIKVPFVKRFEKGENPAEWCENLYADTSTQRKEYEYEWCLNASFLAGNQSMREAAIRDMQRFGRVADMPKSAKAQMVANRILVLVRQGAAMVNTNLSQQIAIAATSDEDDVSAAELATDFLRGRYSEDDEPTKRLNEILWAMVCGRVYRKTVWDPDERGRGADGTMQEIGDISTITLNPWRIHIQPGISAMEEPTWLIESDVRDIDEINDLYPKRSKDIVPEEYADAVGALDRLLVNLVEDKSGSTVKRENAAILKRLHIRPDNNYPKGRLFVWCNGVLLQDVDLPEGEMPFTPVDWFPVPGRAYPLPFITPLRDPQKLINDTLNQQIKLKDAQMRGDMVVNGLGEVTQEYAKKVKGYDSDGNPILFPSQQKIIRTPVNTSFSFLTYDFNTEQAMVLTDAAWSYMMDGGGIRETTLGQNPPSGTTATQILALKEADSAGMSLFNSQMDGVSYPKISRQKLMVARNHYHMPRMVRIVGAKSVKSISPFYGADLRNTEDVRPKPMPVLSEAQKLAAIDEAVAKGLFDFTGSANAKMGKVRGIMALGIPNIEEEIEEQLGMSIEDLTAAAAEENQMQLHASKLALVAQIRDLEMAMAQQEAQTEQMTAPEVQEPANPMEMMMQMRGQGGGVQAVGRA
jgi:hypothetical protein